MVNDLLLNRTGGELLSKVIARKFLKAEQKTITQHLVSIMHFLLLFKFCHNTFECAKILIYDIYIIQ